MYHVSLYNVCFERKMLQLAVSIVITIDNLDLLYRAKSNFFGILFIIFIVYIMFFFSFIYFFLSLFTLRCISFPVPVSSNSNAYESVRKGSAFLRERKPSDGTDDLHLSSIIGSG